MTITSREADLFRLRSEWTESWTASAVQMQKLFEIGMSFFRENGCTTVGDAAARREEGLEMAEQIISVFERQQAGLNDHLARWPEEDELGKAVRGVLETANAAVADLVEQRGKLEAIDPNIFSSGERAPVGAG